MRDLRGGLSQRRDGELLYVQFWYSEGHAFKHLCSPSDEYENAGSSSIRGTHAR